MNEADVRQEVYAMLRRYGYWPTRGRDASSCPRCKFQILPPIGRPDLLVLSPKGRNRVVEVKVVDLGRFKSFAFSEITLEQRAWLDAWAREGGPGYIAIGTINERPRRLWIVDWKSWCQIEEKMLPLRKSIPVDGGKRIDQEIKDMTNLCVPWALLRISGGWDLPMGHNLLDHGVNNVGTTI